MYLLDGQEQGNLGWVLFGGIEVLHGPRHKDVALDRPGDDGSPDASQRASDRAAHLDHAIAERLLERREELVHGFGQQVGVLWVHSKRSEAVAGLCVHEETRGATRRDEVGVTI
jgi:hypothetical protein